MIGQYFMGTKHWTGKDGKDKDVVFVLGNNRYGDPGVNACYCDPAIRAKAEGLNMPIGTPLNCRVDFGGHLLDFSVDNSFVKLPIDVKSAK